MPRLTANPPKPTANAISGLPELILPAQLTEALGINKATLWRWNKSGNAPKRITVAGKVFYAREDVLIWLNAHKHMGA
jgi:predicted DNA-binding transcriptional regulator AlpA